MSDTPETPETHEAIERWHQGKINIFDELARLERERNQWRKVAGDLKKYLWERIDYDDGVYLDWEAEAITEFNRLKGFTNA